MNLGGAPGAAGSPVGQEDLHEAFQHHVEAGATDALGEDRLAGRYLDQQPARDDVIERGRREVLEDHRAPENVPVAVLGQLHEGPILAQTPGLRRTNRLALTEDPCARLRSLPAPPRAIPA